MNSEKKSGKIVTAVEVDNLNFIFETFHDYFVYKDRFPSPHPPEDLQNVAFPNSHIWECLFGLLSHRFPLLEHMLQVYLLLLFLPLSFWPFGEDVVKESKFFPDDYWVKRCGFCESVDVEGVSSDEFLDWS
jgi:hypothetical protein